VCSSDLEKYGNMLFIAIGATDVGTVKFRDETMSIGNKIHKGDEIGRFEFGGSSILVLFQKGRIHFDEDLLKYSKQKIMIDVEVGMSLGCLQAQD